MMRKNRELTIGKRQHVIWGMNRQNTVMEVNVPSMIWKVQCRHIIYVWRSRSIIRNWLLRFPHGSVSNAFQRVAKGEVMIPFHVQILTHYTYRVEYKPIFKSHESHLLMKGVRNRNTVTMDPNSHYIWWSQFLLTSPLSGRSVGRS